MSYKGFCQKTRHASYTFQCLFIPTQDNVVLKENANLPLIFLCGTQLTAFSDGLKVNFVLIQLADYWDAGRWETEMGRGQHLISQLQTSRARHILAGNIHRVSSNRPRPWSSSHRITAWAPQSKYAYSNLLTKGSFQNLYITGPKIIHQWTISRICCVTVYNRSKPHKPRKHIELIAFMVCILQLFKVTNGL